MLIMSGSPDVAELRSKIANFLEVEIDGQLAEATVDVLSRLEDAGLIEPVH